MLINNIDAVITDQVYQQIITSLEQIVDELPFMLSLTPEERQSIQSVSDGRLPYVLKCLEYSQAHHKRIGMSLEDLEELESIAILFTRMGELLRRTDDIRISIRDTLMMIGAIYYRLCRAAHGQMKIAYDKGRPGIGRMLDDLDKLFENQGNFKSVFMDGKPGNTPAILGNNQTNAPGEDGPPA